REATVRLHQIVLVASTLLASWLAMQAVHECGHVLGACLTGGRVERVVLWPLTISRTDLASNPRPLIVVWAGPLFGVAVPLLLWLWHGQGPHFGLGRAKGAVNAKVAYVTLAGCVLLLVLAFAVGGE